VDVCPEQGGRMVINQTAVVGIDNGGPLSTGEGVILEPFFPVVLDPEIG